MQLVFHQFCAQSPFRNRASSQSSAKSCFRKSKILFDYIHVIFLSVVVCEEKSDVILGGNDIAACLVFGESVV